MRRTPPAGVPLPALAPLQAVRVAFAPWSALREEIPRHMSALQARLRAEAE
ncbi:hypothetical protein [Paenibacillus mucilaginosus]|uniref:hypothetical protein n=1 Tax=Paenibacillus mucilaginosus TaxID=61624 RepID=UPI0002E26192|nr:hypothetical protein [Paenibacillus mucilaginosus]